MISRIQRSVLLASGVAALALASSPAFAATSSGFDTVGSTIMPFAINGGNEVMNLQADGLHFDPGAAIKGLTHLDLVGPLTINEGWNPDQGIAINSNQIWKNVTTGDSNLYI